MPFRAIDDNELVVPAMVKNQQSVVCPACDGTMYARGGQKRARHFYHINQRAGGESCSGPATGESATHARCVALAVAVLQDTFGDQAASCVPEAVLEVSDSGSPHQTRRADALLEFADWNPYFGNGLIIEVQHQHHEKDIRMTTHDYLTCGYSVAWLSAEDFDEEHLEYDVVDTAFQSTNGEGYSVRGSNPRRFITCSAYQYSGTHSWGTVPAYVLTVDEAYEICLGEGCSLRRQYDPTAEKYVYDSETITPPELPLKVLRDALVTKYPREFDGDSHRNPGLYLEKLLAERPEIGECLGPKGFHEWTEPGDPWESWGGDGSVRLKACQHCSTHLFADLRGYESDHEYILFSEMPEREWDLYELDADPRRCENERHDEGKFWYDSCPDCGVSNP
jgi:hypothetical protein